MTQERLVKRHEAWRYAYHEDPYLCDASLEAIAERSRDIGINMLKVHENGALSPGAPSAESRNWWELWTHILEELGLRGVGLRSDLDLLPDYDLDGPGLRILRGAKLPSSPYLARVGKDEHLRQTFELGRIRISPASAYANASLNAAIQDDELCVTAKRSARNTLRRPFRNVGWPATEPPPNGEVSCARRWSKNFHLLCLTYRYDLRLLQDFGGDSLIIIKDPGEFARRLTGAMRVLCPSWKVIGGAIQYYDPYFANVDRIWPPMAKHFRYFYQQEIRFAWFGPDAENLEPVFVDIGPLSDIADYYSLKSFA